ncbi:LysR substrate-binding domain-containing protein [Piscinibacter sakaiensis]|uniref:HTH lysR-type domain-containing protein n=1 Tax=Piscinibacter sakaiensis TaxID=1547922 RepID=A0A0K8NXG2_PISS1|nr:LysR substrate-binding domain-containing protein [Piscinibacter sakaiensis]GAP35063.1 hypothetical protein ISF6_0628 [Piscinibacter sakaiensis]
MAITVGDDVPAAAPADAAAGLRDEALAGRLRLRHLQCVLAVADTAHLGRAAERLCITQPAVTKTLNELEALLGQRLFERSRQGTRVLEAAAPFLRHAREALRALGAAVDSVAPGREAGALRVGALPTVAAALLTPVLASGLARDPALRLQLHTGRNAALLAQLRAGELDLVLGRLGDPEAMAGLAFEPLRAEPLVIAMRPGHALAPDVAGRGPAGGPARRGGHGPGPVPPPAGLDGVPPPASFGACLLLLPLPGTQIRQVADAFLARHGLVPRAGLVETLDGALALALVQDADALWITPLSAVVRELAAGRLQRWPTAITPSEAIGLLRRADSPPGPAALRLGAALRSVAAPRDATVTRRPRARR